MTLNDFIAFQETDDALLLDIKQHKRESFKSLINDISTSTSPTTYHLLPNERCENIQGGQERDQKSWSIFFIFEEPLVITWTGLSMI